ncbi:hypothetical protein GGU11DRAFT_761463 [Lentinula aff. detonsa]|nr:hypothetical protein GGU11DRAFT_761463 [Lentinula aff. detonsa]
MAWGRSHAWWIRMMMVWKGETREQGGCVLKNDGTRYFAVVDGGDDGGIGDTEAGVAKQPMNNGPFVIAPPSIYRAILCKQIYRAILWRVYDTARKRWQTRRKNRFISDEAQDDQEEGIEYEEFEMEDFGDEDNEDVLYQEQRNTEYQAKLDGEKGRSDSNDVHNTFADHEINDGKGLFQMTRSGDMSMPSIFTGLINDIETRYGLGEYFSSPPSPAPGPSHPPARSLAPLSPDPSALSVPLHPPSPLSVSRSSKAHPSTSPQNINPPTGKPVWIKTPMDTSWGLARLTLVNHFGSVTKS